MCLLERFVTMDSESACNFMQHKAHSICKPCLDLAFIEKAS